MFFFLFFVTPCLWHGSTEREGCTIINGVWVGSGCGCLVQLRACGSVDCASVTTGLRAAKKASLTSCAMPLHGQGDTKQTQGVMVPVSPCPIRLWHRGQRSPLTLRCFARLFLTPLFACVRLRRWVPLPPAGTWLSSHLRGLAVRPFCFPVACVWFGVYAQIPSNE